MSIGFILVLIGLFATLVILLVGIIGMARGGEFNKKYGNKLMRMRVIAQFGTIILLFILGLMSVAD
ncbi:MAG: twin transmembrane helix small protein [Sphingomonadales bacterium]